MSEGRSPSSLTMAVISILREPSMLLGAGLSVGLFVSMSLLPLFGVFLGIFTPAPLFFFYYRRGRLFGLTMTGLAILGVLAIYALVGRSFGVIFFFECAILAVVMAEAFIRRLGPTRAVGYPAGVILGMGVVLMLGASLFLGQNPWDFAKAVVERQVHGSLQVYELLLSGGDQAPGQPAPALQDQPRGSAGEVDPAPLEQPEQAEETPSGLSLSPELTRLASVLISLFPGFMVLGTILVVWANFMVGRHFVGRTAGLPPEFSDLTVWSAPEPLIWVVIACGFGIFLPFRTLNILAANGLLMLGLLYFFQGLSIVAFWLEKKGAPVFLKTAAYTLIALMQTIDVMIAALGLFDMWFDFRKLKKSQPGFEA